MAFNTQGNKSQTLDVTELGQSIAIPVNSQQCRVWNEGPDAARVVYGTSSATAADDDLVMPASFVEVHTKGIQDYLAAKTAPGKTARLHIICGQGD